jgi:hypothetical protein
MVAELPKRRQPVNPLRRTVVRRKRDGLVVTRARLVVMFELGTCQLRVTVWIDLPTADGQYVVNFYVCRGDVDSYRGDGKLGIILGGTAAD